MGLLLALAVLNTVLTVGLSSDGKWFAQELELQQNMFENKCMGELGCFWNGPPFYDPVYRPISVRPFNQEFIQTKFLLFGPRNPKAGALIQPDLESLRQSGFEPQLHTKVIIEKYNSTLKPGDFSFIMKDMILLYGDYNVILVNWSDSNGPPYPQAVANARVVGAQLAQLILFLKEHSGIFLKSVHLIGHSLGAHLAGWAGEKLQNLGRITGLDPAGPYFYKAERVVRLDTSDALFVDIIHTNAGSNYQEGSGIDESIGHLDFYPNGGKRQPGCSQTSVQGSQMMKNSCNHAKAVVYFIASILRQGCFEGLPCDSWSSFIEGRCNYGLRNALVPFPVEMGFHAQKNFLLKEGQPIFLRTAAEPPYCNSEARPEHSGLSQMLMPITSDVRHSGETIIATGNFQQCSNANCQNSTMSATSDVKMHSK